MLFEPVALKVGTTPETIFEFASLSVIVISEVEVPSGLTGLVPAMVELVALATPATKLIPLPDFTTGVRICGILLSALVDLSEHVEFPETSLEVHKLYILVVPVLVALKVGVDPETGLL